MTNIMVMKEKKNVGYANQLEMAMAMGFNADTASKEDLVKDLTREVKMRFSGDVDKNVNRTISQFKKLWNEDKVSPIEYIMKHHLGLHYMAIAATVSNLVKRY